MSWNVQGAVPPNGSKERIRNQIEFIDSAAGCSDVLMLNEVTTGLRILWRESLADLGYGEIVDTLDWAHELGESTVPPHHELRHVNGNLIAIHETSDGTGLQRQCPSIRNGRWDNIGMKDWSTNFPEKILNAELKLDGSTIDLWNIRTVPGSSYGEEKIKIFENTYNRIIKSEDRKRILAGDFNSPKAELPGGTVIPFGFDRNPPLRERWIRAELNIHTGLEACGMVDVFRHIHGYGDIDVEDTSFQSKRFDHIFASKTLNPERCRYNHDGYDCSDHAPIVAEFDP